MRVPEENGHIHDFDISPMKPKDTWFETQTTLNASSTSKQHDHNVHVWFDSEKQKFIIDTSPGGRTFTDQHTHPQMEVEPGELDGSPLLG